jgi:hypothetical protein
VRSAIEEDVENDVQVDEDLPQRYFPARCRRYAAALTPERLREPRSRLNTGGVSSGSPPASAIAVR